MRTALKRVAVAIILAGPVLATAGPSSAALSDCTGTNMCMWGSNNFTFIIGQRQAGYSTIVNLSGDANNQMDSWANKSSVYTGCMYDGINGGPGTQTMSKVSSDANVAPWNSDDVSSWKTAGGC